MFVFVFSAFVLTHLFLLLHHAYQVYHVRCLQYVKTHFEFHPVSFIQCTIDYVLGHREGGGENIFTISLFFLNFRIKIILFPGNTADITERFYTCRVIILAALLSSSVSDFLITRSHVYRSWLGTRQNNVKISKCAWLELHIYDKSL